MVLPSVRDLKIANKRVLLRTNYDVPLERQTTDDRRQRQVVADETRIEESLPTVEYLLKQRAQTIIISHLGRPRGKKVAELSLKLVAEALSSFLGFKVPLVDQFNKITDDQDNKIIILENLRFWPGEEENDPGFARQLASLADYYVNDAFAVSHRQHASLVGLPKLLPSAFGFDCLEEIKTLRQVRENPARPVVLILGGRKKSKLATGPKLAKWADWILIGGTAATYQEQIEPIKKATRNLIVATRKGEDITLEAIERFAKLIKEAKTIVWAGPLGLYTDPRYERGTRKVAELVAGSSAYKVVGGGETEAALTKFGLERKIDYISSGGGAMLFYLAEETLPAIEAIIKKDKRNTG